jgi:threonylcarbamoyladenosine tRNA methylthiotransferase MtaB
LADNPSGLVGFASLDLPYVKSSSEHFMPTLRTVTLGCKVNQYETQYVREGLLRLGYRDAEDGEPADLCVVNTCTVTAEGDFKSRKAIRRLAKQNPHARIIVMGCYATRDPEAVAALPGVVEVVTDKRDLPELLRRWGLLDLPTGISDFQHRHRAWVKVQDGCRLRCSYCIIPAVRPVLVSRPVDEVLAEIRRLMERGFREIVLVGIHLGHYGLDLSQRRPDGGPVRLTHLLRQIVALEGEFRVRLSSLEPQEVTPGLIAVLAENPERICPHLHIALQHGSDAVLARMQRRGGIRAALDRCLLARRSLDEPGLTTDIIVGFPGETEDDFHATCRVVEEVEFSKIHIFRFSPREGTPAATMPDQVDGTVKHRRATELAKLGERLRTNYLRRLVKRRIQVLVESPIPDFPGHLAGTADRYVPVTFPGPATLEGRIVWLDISGMVGGRLVGELPSEEGPMPRNRVARP